MNILFQFNSRSSGQNVPAAKAIANRCGGIIEDNSYKIQFSSPEDENLNQLYELVGNLKGSQISIDEGEPVDARKFFIAANCEQKLLCKGLCSHVRFGYYPLEQFLEQTGDFIEEGCFSVYEERVIQMLSNFLEPTGENRFKINKPLFLEYFNKQTEIEQRFCANFDFEKIKAEIEKLPNEIQLITREEYTDRYQPEEFDLVNWLKTFLVSCEIDSKLSFNEILECSETVGLILSASRPIGIENTDTLLYSFPYIKRFLLLKANIMEEGDNFELEDEEEGEEREEVKPLIYKENDFYVVKTNFVELYFIAFKKSDANAANYYNMIKKM